MSPRTSCIGGSIAKVQRRCMAGGVEQGMEREIGDGGWPGSSHRLAESASACKAIIRSPTELVRMDTAIRQLALEVPEPTPKRENGVPLKRTTHPPTTTDVMTRLAM
uniref:Uncharacterized protein n=1 Tax=Oryza nivara TaxID=4536 RepID=A0A0E0FHL5_ORYNI